MEAKLETIKAVKRLTFLGLYTQAYLDNVQEENSGWEQEELSAGNEIGLEFLLMKDEEGVLMASFSLNGYNGGGAVWRAVYLHSDVSDMKIHES